METELKSLEDKLTILIDAHRKACAENRELGARVAALQSENKRLGDRLAQAAERVADILARLPEEDEA